MRTKTVLFVVTLFVMQTYAMNMNAPDSVLDFEADELSTSGRSSNVMPAISDAMQQYILDTQDQNGDDDNDGDGIADSVDKDDDNDCIPDIWDSDSEDFDGDGINDADDDDDDDDGINDSEEVTDTDNMTNIYDADNDGYHDCSSMGILHMNMLDVYVDALADGSIYFNINATNLLSGQSASMFWNLVDTDDFLQLNNSTTGFVVPTVEYWVEDGNWYGLPDGPYCLNVELSGSDASGNSDVLDSEQVCFTIDSSSNGGGGGSGVVDDCGSDYNFSSIDSYEFPNGISPDQDFVLAVTSTCLVDGVHYDMMISISDSSNSTLQTEYFDWFGSDLDETHSATISGLSAGDYFLYVDLLSITHSVYLDTLFVPFTIEPSAVGYCSFPTFGATPTELLPGDDLTFTWTMDGDISPQVYLSVSSGWGSQYYYSDIVQNDGSHTITLPYSMNPNHDYVIYIESSYDDNRSYQCWKYGSIDILFEGEEPVENETVPTPTVDETPRISMWFGKVNQHNENGTWMTDPDGVAGAGTYADWGDEGWGDRKLEYCQRFWPSTVDVVLRDLPEEIVFYTRGNTDAYLTMKPVWLCVQDTDEDGILDPEDQDDDNDGWADIMEEVCFSDSLDANVVPDDLDGDGLCDALQRLLIEDYEPAKPSFCTNGEITGGNGLLGQTEFNEVVVIEMTGGNYQYQYEIQDTSNNLYSDIVQQPSEYDFRGYYEYYDIFVSNEDGEFDINGSFITIQARSDLETSNLGVGHNIDSIGLRDASGNVIYATKVVSVELGDNLGSSNPAGWQDKILGPADQTPTALGNNEASITVSFCPADIATDDDDDTIPGFGVMSALVALGAAMLAGRRSSTEDDE